MFLNRLKLTNFRNYDNAELVFDAKKTLIIGKNAQGKTNLLEAIYYLSNLKTFRAKNDNELMFWDKDFFQLKCGLDKSGMDFELEILVNPPRKKLLKVNGVKKSKASEFCRYLNVVNFTSNDLMLLKGSKDNRRDWLDVAISQIYPAYIDRLNKYNKIKLQKNNLLKSIKLTASVDYNLLEVFNSQLTVTGSNLIFLRLKFLKELQKVAKIKHKQIAPSEDLSICYNSTVVGDFDIEIREIPPIEEIAGLYKQKLSEEFQNELIRMQCLVGSHRDDVDYFINKIDSKKYSSSGQQRTIVLSLKLAELELIQEKLGDYPLLLLDDVLAELDDVRQNYLLSSIEKEVQMLITSVDTLHFNNEYLSSLSICKIDNGKIL